MNTVTLQIKEHPMQAKPSLQKPKQVTKLAFNARLWTAKQTML